MHTTKTRLALAGRIAAGAMANPENMAGDWESRVARDAWSLAGKLCRIAAQHEADTAPAAVAERAKAYAGATR